MTMTPNEVIELAQSVLRLRKEGQEEQAKAKLAHLGREEHARVTRCITELESNPPDAVVIKDKYD